MRPGWLMREAVLSSAGSRGGSADGHRKLSFALNARGPISILKKSLGVSSDPVFTVFAMGRGTCPGGAGFARSLAGFTIEAYPGFTSAGAASFSYSTGTPYSEESRAFLTYAS